ncbi:MAG TPA: hypothetical protein PKA39_08635, partial [Ignavibacteria bacterium]|nr:hypothetical protein [Ignavibacteria bacterium]
MVVSTPLGDVISDGFFVDFWYDGNHYRPSNIYRNEFNQTSFPNSKSYSNIDSRVCLSAFSQIGPTMTFNYQLCGNITNIGSYPRFIGLDNSGNTQPVGIDYNGNGFDEVFVNVKDSLYGFRDNGNSIRVDMPNGFLKDSVAQSMVGFLNYNIGGNDKYIVGVYGNKFSLLNFVIDSATGAPIVNQVVTPRKFTSPVYIPTDVSQSKFIFAGTKSGIMGRYNVDSNTVTFFTPGAGNFDITQLAAGLGGTVQPILTYIDASKKFFAQSLINITGQQPIDPVSFPVYVTSDNKLNINNPTVISNNLGINTLYSSPVIADLNKDGSQDIIFSADSKLYAVNQNGVPLDHFPFTVPNVSRISSGCAIADINSDGINDVIFGTGDGRIYAYGSNGRIVDGFPLTTGGVVNSTPALINTGG